MSSITTNFSSDTGNYPHITPPLENERVNIQSDDTRPIWEKYINRPSSASFTTKKRNFNIGVHSSISHRKPHHGRALAKSIAPVWRKKVYKPTMYEHPLIKRRNFRPIIEDSRNKTPISEISFRPISAPESSNFVKNSFPKVIRPMSKKAELPAKKITTNGEKTIQKTSNKNKIERSTLLLMR